MGDISIVATEWRTVQVGRVVLVQEGKDAGRLAAIVEIIDHKRVRSRSPIPRGGRREMGWETVESMGTRCRKLSSGQDHNE